MILTDEGIELIKSIVNYQVAEKIYEYLFILIIILESSVNMFETTIDVNLF